MTDGVAEIQELPSSPVKFILQNDVSFHLHTGLDHSFQLRAHGPFNQGIKKSLVSQNSVFDDLGATADELLFRQGFQCLRITQYPDRLIKSADKILALGQINGGFPPDRGIYHGQKRSGDLGKIDPPQIRGCGKTAKVAGDAAAQGDHQIRAGHVLPCHKTQKLCVGLQGLVLFAGWVKEGDDAKACLFQTVLQALAVQGINLLTADNHSGIRTGDLTQKFSAPVQNPGFDQNVIGSGGPDNYGSQCPSTSSFLRRPSSSRRISSSRSSCSKAVLYSFRCSITMDNSRRR